MIEQQRIIEQLKAGNPEVIRTVYTGNRVRCLTFLQSLGLSGSDAEDVYQDAMIALVENARRGKIDQLQSALSTYLFAIAKFMAFRVLRNEKRHSNMLSENEQDMDLTEANFSWQDLDEEAEQPEVILLRKHLGRLGERCRDILRMAYFEGKSADEIAATLGYPSKDVLKSQKSRCLRQLRSFFNQQDDHG